MTLYRCISRTGAYVVAALSLMGFTCHRIAIPGTPCTASIDGKTVRADCATPTVAPTPSPTAAPKLPPPPISTPGLMIWLAPIDNMATADGQCVVTSPKILGDVRAAEQYCEEEFPAWMGRPGNVPNRSNWTSWYLCVASRLVAMGYDSAVDDCNCGDVEVATKGGATSEIYHVLDGGSGDVVLKYTGTCDPRPTGFVMGSAAPPTPVPTATLAATTELPQASLTCPKLRTVEAAPKGGGQAQMEVQCAGDASLRCLPVDVTPRFWGGSCSNPANGCPSSPPEHDSFGIGSHRCEPTFAGVRYQYSGHCEWLDDGGMIGRLRGAPGCDFMLTPVVVPGTSDQGGAVMDLSQYKPMSWVGNL